MTLFHWEKLSPTEFHQLQEYTTYAVKKLKDVLTEYYGGTHQMKQDELIDFSQFRRFLTIYLEADIPEDLCRHLFLSFLKRPTSAPVIISKPAAAEPLGAIVESVVDKDPGKLSLVAESIVRRSSSRKIVSNCIDINACGASSIEAWPPVRQSLLDKSRCLLRRRSTDVRTGRISIKDVICCLSLLEAGRPEDKLEFMFRLYDTDGNGILDSNEIDCIVNHMMTVADYLGWDISELKPILEDMMRELDYDSDGTVSLEEWKRGGLTNIPLLVLLGMDSNLKNEGSHVWRLKHFNKPAYCNLCLSVLLGLGKQGLRCIFCKYTVHERCASRVPACCITTYVKSKKVAQPMTHHWVEGNCAGKCDRCKKFIKAYNRVTGRRCRWCKLLLHNRCASQVSPACDLGEFHEHIVAPTSICPAVLGRRRRDQDQDEDEVEMEKMDTGGECAGNNTEGLPGSLQIMPAPDTVPLLVFLNPKSGGHQGTKLLRKFQYLLNPRQVCDVVADGGFMAGLQFFKDVTRFRILCCGGDGTVGWLLDSVDKMLWSERPPVAVLPLGTGNDLARCLHWGGGYEGESLKKVLHLIAGSEAVLMDRWQVELSAPPSFEPENDEDIVDRADPMPANIINNYFSIGVDASIAHRFHVMREKHPEKFNSRMKNKLWYFEFGTSETLRATCKNLHENVDIMCDGYALDLGNGPSMEGIALLNIPSIYGGSNLWGDSAALKKRKKNAGSVKDHDREYSSGSMSSVDLSFTIQNIGDRLIEIVGLENTIHVAQVKGGIQSGKRLAQCSNVVIRTRRTFPMQIDGEPWMQPPCTISITHKNQVPMLMAPSSSRKSSFFGFLRR